MLRQTRSIGAAAAFAVLAGLLVALSPGVARAEPVDALYTDQIDAYADYDGADTCSPSDKPGTVALKQAILAAYPGTTGSISRACGGQSEHSEGRALDWMVSVGSQNDLAEDFLRWLLAEDAYGNDHAMARRFGIMYVIWNHEVWRAYDAAEGWQPYSGPNPHTDHIHLSMSWDGALRETTWFTGTELGMRMDQARVAATWRSRNRLDVLRRGPSGQLQQRTWADGWQGWVELGGGLTSSPAAVWAGGSLWVFARGADGKLHQRRWRSSSGWGPWQTTGVEISAAPGVASQNKRIDLVVRTPSGSVAHRAWKPKREWSSWRDLGGVVTSPPAAVWRGRDHLDVFARGTNGGLYQQSKIDGSWTGWSSLGGSLSSGPAATSFNPGRVDLFVRGASATVVQRTDSGSGWGSWVNLGGRHVSGPATASLPGTRIDVLTRNRGGGLNQNTYLYGTGWTGWLLR